MTLKGHIEKGTVVLDEPVKLPDGMSVDVELRPRQAADEAPTLYEDTGPTWTEVFGDLAGSVEGLPSDMAENHDHYIHGAPKGIDKQ